MLCGQPALELALSEVAESRAALFRMVGDCYFFQFSASGCFDLSGFSLCTRLGAFAVKHPANFELVPLGFAMTENAHDDVLG